jgi:hypothetical protein
MSGFLIFTGDSMKSVLTGFQAVCFQFIMKQPIQLTVFLQHGRDHSLKPLQILKLPVLLLY